MNKWKRLAAVLLVFALMFSFCQTPLAALAAETESSPTEAVQTQPQETPPEDIGQTLPRETDPPDSTESTGSVDVAEPATEPSTNGTTEATTEPTTETPTEAATESTAATETTEETTNQLEAQLGAKDVMIRLSMPIDVPADTTLSIQEGEPIDAQMLAIMEKYSIQNALDFFVWDLAADMDVSGTVRATVTFQTPYLNVLSSASVGLFLVGNDGQITKLPVDVRISPEKKATTITFSLEEFNHTARLIFISEDSPDIESTTGGGFQVYSEYTVRASNGAIQGIGDSQGGLTYHCWSSKGGSNASTIKPAICLDSDRLFGSGDNTWGYGWCTSSNTDDDEGPTGSWKGLPKSIRDKLVLLCAYGVGWSPSSRYGVEDGNTFAAMQLVAWEWINGKSEGTYTSHYNGTVQSIASGLRSYVRNNPDGVDPKKTSVYVIWPQKQKVWNGSYVWGQTLICLWNIEYYPENGDLTVTKAVTGNGSIADWKMELYTSQSAANSGTGYIASAYTDSNGVATFSNLDAGTYYIREAPASRQDRVNVTGWTLSTEVKSGNVSAGSTTNAGTITNTAPAGAITVKKSLRSNGTLYGKFDGWIFQVSKNTNFSPVVSTITTDVNGEGSTGKVLSPGTYYVREAPLANQTRSDKNNFILDNNVVTVTLKGTETVLADNGTGVTATNIELSAITVQKAVNSADPSGKLENWVFQIASDAKFSNIVKTLTTDKDGFASTGVCLNPGIYYVREAPLANQTRTDKNDYVLDNDTVITVTLQAGETKAALHTANATAVNVEKGMIRIRKGVVGTEQTADKLQGWIFQISASEDFGTILSTVTTGADGYAVSAKMDPGTYYVREAPMENQVRNDKAMWSQNAQPIKVTVQAGSTVDALNESGYTAENYYGKRLNILKLWQCDENTSAQLDGNAMYSLAGAEYNVIVDGTVVETLVTDAEGKAVSKEVYQVGTKGTLEEVTAPSGFLLNSTPVEFTIPAGSDDYVVEVSDPPTFDPIRFAMKKVDAITDIPMGDATFEGAVYRWDYFDNLTHSGAPVRTWHFVTDENGMYRYSSQFLADSSQYASDELFLNGITDVYELPLGSVMITEVLAPSGYSIMQPLYGTITQSSSGVEAKWEWDEKSAAYLTEISGGYSAPEPQDEASFGSLSIQKVDKDLGTEIPEGIHFAGCQFSVYNRSANAVKVGDNPIAQPGEVCYVLTADESGKAFTEAIFPLGTYEVKETRGNDFFTVNEDWSYTFSVAEGKTEFAAECANTMLPVTIHVQKVNVEGTALAGAKFILEWSEDGKIWAPVSFDEQIAKGSCSSKGLAEDGSLVTDETGEITFSGLYPLLSYRIIEAATPNGYSLLSEPIMVDTPTYEQEYEVSYKVVDGHVFALPKTGAADMPLLSIGIAMSLAAGMIALIYWKKKKF